MILKKKITEMLSKKKEEKALMSIEKLSKESTIFIESDLQKISLDEKK